MYTINEKLPEVDDPVWVEGRLPMPRGAIFQIIRDVDEEDDEDEESDITDILVQFEDGTQEVFSFDVFEGTWTDKLNGVWLIYINR